MRLRELSGWLFCVWIDNLGAAFMADFLEQAAEVIIFARSTASQQMSLFFKFHINHFAEGKNLTIIYAGGDDVFAIGSWQDVIDFAVDIRQKFIAYNGKLTLFRRCWALSG